MGTYRTWRVVLPMLALVSGLAVGTTAVASDAADRAQRPNLSIQTLKQISMVTPSIGYGLFSASGAGACSVVVGKTTNGGRTFGSQVVVEHWHCGSNYGGSSISSDSFGDVFVWGHGLWVSNDDAARWIAVPHVGHVLSVSSVGGSLWLVSAACPTSQATLCPLRVEMSSNLGRSWFEPTTQPFGAKGYSNPVPAYGTSPLVRASADVAYVVSSLPYSSKSDPMWVTTDGGASWSKRFVRCAGQGGGAVLAAAPNGALAAVCGYEGSAGFQSKSVSTSADQGMTWHVYGRCGPPGLKPYDRNAAVLCNGYLGQVVAPAPQSVFETGCRSSVNVSRDGGAHWATVHPIMGNTGFCNAEIDFVNQVDGTVLAATSTRPLAIWQTFNGGRSWKMYLPTVA